MRVFLFSFILVTIPVTVFSAGPIVEAPSVVIQNAQINTIPIPWLSGIHRTIDASLTTFTFGGVRYWFNSNYLMHAKYSGTLENPFAVQRWTKPDAQLITNMSTTTEGYWITNLYQDTAGLLAFIHVEHPTIEGQVYSTGTTRIGLAWSTNNGDTFTYLGHIVSPFGDPNPSNIQGTPYILKDGYFYIYYKDYCTGPSNNGVARAKVADVIAAAKNGLSVSWMKYHQGAWNSAGLGGACTGIVLPSNGINHTDAAYSTYTNKYYMILSTMNWGGGRTWIKLYESTDGLAWSFIKNIVEEPAARDTGYQYVSIVDESGSDNAVVGTYFYVYAAKDPSSVVNTAQGHRWRVSLNEAAMPLLAEWKLDEGVGSSSADSSGMASPLSLKNGPTWVTGRFGTGLAFDGVNDYATAGDVARLEGLRDFSLSLWTKLDVLPSGNTTLIGKEYGHRFIISPNGGGHFALGTTGSTWYGSGSYASFPPLALGKWNHLVGTYDGTNIRVYVNGVQVSTSTPAIFGSTVNNVYEYTIGYPVVSTLVYTRGALDEVQIYGKALSSSEVSNLYQKPSNPRDPAIVPGPFVFTAGYSGEQEKNHWGYKARSATSSVLSLLSYNPAPWNSAERIWQGNETYVLIGPGWLAPGAAYDTLLTFTSPVSGNVRVTGTVADGDVSCGDGVTASVQKNGSTIWSKTIANGGTSQSHDISFSVVQNDVLFFTVHKRTNNYCDVTQWDPIITYVPLIVRTQKINHYISNLLASVSVGLEQVVEVLKRLFRNRSL